MTIEAHMQANGQWRATRHTLEGWGGNAKDATADLLAQEAAAPPVDVPSVAARTEFGWLIENGKQAGQGLAYRFIDNDAGGGIGWTEDHNKALRFARRADAEQFAHHDEDAWRIVEHGWDTAIAETRAASEGER